MPNTVTADDIDRAAARLDIQLTDWQRTFLADAFTTRARLDRWPYFHFGRRTCRSAITRVGLAALSQEVQ